MRSFFIGPYVRIACISSNRGYLSDTLIDGSREHCWDCKIFASFYFCFDLKKIVNFDMAGPNLAEISTLELIHVGNCSSVFGRS